MSVDAKPKVGDRVHCVDPLGREYAATVAEVTTDERGETMVVPRFAEGGPPQRPTGPLRHSNDLRPVRWSYRS